MSSPAGRAVSWRDPPNPKLVRDLRAGNRAMSDFSRDPSSIPTGQKVHATKSKRQRRLEKLAFHEPDLQEAILTGKLSVFGLEEIPLSWSNCERHFTGNHHQ